MYQCKITVDNSQYDIYNTTCRTKCFVRIAEDHAIYRGCFDDFADVKDLSYGYVGCRNQSWNNRQLPWCLCDTAFCNGVSMRHIGSYSGMGTVLNRARTRFGLQRTKPAPDRAYEGDHTSRYEMKETSYGSSYNVYAAQSKPSDRRQAAKQGKREDVANRINDGKQDDFDVNENSTETSEKLDDVPSFPSRNADKGPGNVFLPTENDSKYDTVRFDGGAIYGHRLDQRIPPPGHNPVRGHNGRGEQRGGYLQRGSYDGKPQVPLHHDHLSYEHVRHAGNLKQPHLGMLDRNRSIQRSYQDSIYANVYERQPEDGRHQATQESGLGRYLSGGNAGDPHRPAGGRDTEANSVAAFTKNLHLQSYVNNHEQEAYRKPNAPVHASHDNARGFSPDVRPQHSRSAGNYDGRYHNVAHTEYSVKSPFVDHKTEPYYGHKQQQNNDDAYPKIPNLVNGRYPEKLTAAQGEHHYRQYIPESSDDEIGSKREAIDVRYKRPHERRNTEFIYGDIAASMYPSFPKDLAAHIQCVKTGFYRNPTECATFVACIHDPRLKTPIMHLMHCPKGLLWDDNDKVCSVHSTTCGSNARKEEEQQGGKGKSYDVRGTSRDEPYY
ncbi:hypothetical protein LSAT2_030914 [Lamellibrachia satsuma]|nr:hypothetical protein LSAT2_030914 [Lamellibrachia satsuma]